MRFDKHINLKTGFMALALAAAGGLTLTATPATAAGDGHAYEEHGDYMQDMGERISRADKEFTNENEAGNVDEDLQDSWETVETEWSELEDATEENWEDAKAEMDDAWDDFQKEWDENFSHKEK